MIRYPTPAMIPAFLVLSLLLSGVNAYLFAETSPDQATDSSQQKKRIAVAQFMHETCTFCPGDEPGIEDWTRLGDPAKGDDVFNLSGYVRGFAKKAGEYTEIELIGLTSPVGVYGGISRTWNQEIVFEHFVGKMLEDLEEAGPVDGIYLALHGAMAVRNIVRPEAEMARRFREAAGPDVPIVATFDLHGNEDEEFLKWADGATPVVLADYWDRTGDATWTLQELIDKNVNGVLYGTLSALPALEEIWKQEIEVGNPVDVEVGGYTGEQAGKPVRIAGTLTWKGSRWGYDRVAVVEFGDGNVLVLTPAYEQIVTPDQLRFGPIEPDDFDVFVLKSRVHFRRGFDETGYAPTIHIVDAPGDWFGTVRLDALEYENVNVNAFYPFGDPFSGHNVMDSQ